jgi:hypothetical protein
MTPLRRRPVRAPRVSSRALEAADPFQLDLPLAASDAGRPSTRYSSTATSSAVCRLGAGRPGAPHLGVSGGRRTAGARGKHQGVSSAMGASGSSQSSLRRCITPQRTPVTAPLRLHTGAPFAARFGSPARAGTGGLNRCRRPGLRRRRSLREGRRGVVERCSSGDRTGR